MGKLAFGLAGVLAATAVAGAFAPYPYGVNAQLTRNEYENNAKALEMMAIAGIRHARIPLTLTEKFMLKDGRPDFSVPDEVFANCDRFGIQVLPIVDAAGDDPNAILSDAGKMAEFRGWMRDVMTHYKGRFRMMEFWNEPNLNLYWKNPNAANYVALLKEVRAIQREIDPGMKLSIAGIAASSMLPYLRRCYEAGAKEFFDVMNVHMYCHPGGPEGWFDITELKALMAEFGDAAKPIIVTETGWQTHLPVIPNRDLIKAGLALARPERKRLRVVHCDLFEEGSPTDQRAASALRGCLPWGGTCESCSPRETIRRLEKGDVDVIVYPFGQKYPADTLDAVVKFVEKGGTLVHFSNLPIWSGGTDVGPAKDLQDGRGLTRFRFGFRNQFSRNGGYPPSVKARPTAAAIAAGAVDGEYVCSKYLCADRRKPGDEMIPLVSGTDETGRTLVPAAVFRYEGGGAVVVSTVPGDSVRPGRRGAVATSTEQEQAFKTVRALSILFAQGIDAVFTYEFRGWEIDPWESELHFGLIHANYVPKPAYSAYMNFVVQRPAGSRRIDAKWMEEDRRTYYPQWIRPDGKPAGMAWTIDPGYAVEMVFDGDATFCDMYGTPRLFKHPAAHTWHLRLSNEPVYFSGARLIGLEREKARGPRLDEPAMKRKEGMK